MKIYHLITGRKKKKKKQIYKISLKERTLEIGSESRTGQKKKSTKNAWVAFSLW
jgi:hypothetical protein